MKRARKLICMTVISALLVTTVTTAVPMGTSQAATVTNHGTDRTKLITEDELSNTPPADYKINQETQGKAKDGLYDQYFLKEDLQTVKIEVPENNLNYLLQNANQKPYVMTDSVTIGDQTVSYAGLKTKGNYTLTNTYEKTTSDRFSFTVNFGKYIKKKDYGDKQNFFGCSKISFNNFFFDKTMMKEYNALRLMTEMGVPTPQYGLAKLYINGEYYGVYFMVEAMDSSILKQYTGESVSDYLTKPEGSNMQYAAANDSYKNSDGVFTLDSLINNGALVKGEDGTYSASADFEKASSALWEKDSDTLQDVAETLPAVLTWQEKLTLLSEGKDFSGKTIDVNSQEYLNLLEQIVDVDETLRYFATHSYIVQMDNMFVNQQNYGLYVDESGKSMLLPWDYDLGWGCYTAPNEPEDVANLNLDKMYTTDVERGKTTAAIYKEYPLFNVIYQNTSLLKKYHQYMEDCAKISALGGTTSDNKTYEAGRFSATIDTLYPKVQEAARITLASNVTYLIGGNTLSQPSALIQGVPNLKKIIARRAVGVWLQTHNISSTVTGYGCDLDALGNGQAGRPSTGGNLTVVDESTGIFAVATYAASFGWGGGTGPSLTVTELTSSNSDYKKAADQIDGSMVMYRMSNTKTPNSSYQLYVPVSEDMKDAKLYSYSSSTGALTELTATAIDNLRQVTVSDLSYIVVAKGTKKDTSETKSETKTETKTTETDSTNIATASKVTLPAVPKIKSVKNTSKKKLTVKWKKVSGASGYVIQYSLKKNFKKAKKVTVKKGTTTKKVIKKLKKGKRYYVRIRAYKKISGKNYYSKWSGKKSVKIKK
jgi:spore coat protein CotH